LHEPITGGGTTTTGGGTYTEVQLPTMTPGPGPYTGPPTTTTGRRKARTVVSTAMMVKRITRKSRKPGAPALASIAVMTAPTAIQNNERKTRIVVPQGAGCSCSGAPNLCKQE